MNLQKLIPPTSIQFNKKHRKNAIKILFIVFLLPIISFGQPTINFSHGMFFSGATTMNFVTFVVENTNNYPVELRRIGTYNPVNSHTLYYSTTDLSGNPNFQQGWTTHMSSNKFRPNTGPTVAVLDDINLLIPANTTMRFALETTGGIYVSGNQSSTNSYSSIGVNLLLGSHILNGDVVGFAGDINGPQRVTSQFFLGSIDLFTFNFSCLSVNGGQSVPDKNIVCSGNPVFLNATGATIASSISYQWQTSPDSLVWTDIPGLNSRGGNYTPSSSGYYRLKVACNNSVAYSTISHVEVITSFLPGTYTINSTQPISANNFQSFNQFADALKCIGFLTGPIVVNVAPNTGPYHESVHFEEVFGVSATNTITINGNGNTLSFLENNIYDLATLAFIGAKYFVIDSLDIQSLSPNDGLGIFFNNGASFITIKNCTVTVADKTASYCALALPAMSYSNVPTDGFDFSVANNLTLENNTFIGGSNGVHLTGQINNEFNNVIKSNKFINQEFRGVHILRQEDISISENEFQRDTLTQFNTIAYYGISLSGVNPGAVLEKNKFHTLMGTVPQSGSNHTISVIRIQGYGTAAKPIQIVNNKAYNINTNVLLVGVDLIQTTTVGVNHIKFLHNTFSLNESLPVASNPLFIRTNTGTFSPNLITDIELKNNIFSTSAPGLFMEIASSATTFNCDNNVYYSPTFTQGTFQFCRIGNSIFTFNQWQTRPPGNDLNSFFGNPFFTDSENGDLTPLSNIGDNLGTFVGVVDDFFGAPRSLADPDIGAVEHVGVTQDVALVSGVIDYNNCLLPNEPIVFTIHNLFGQTLDFSSDTLEIEWEITGPVGSLGIERLTSGILPEGDSLVVSFPKANLTLPGTYTLNAHILPSAVNPIRVNDTIAPFITSQLEATIAVNPKVVFLPNTSQTTNLDATSPYFVPGSGSVHITEIYQGVLSSSYTPTNGWPSYMWGINSYIELTGFPYQDLEGYTLEQWFQVGGVETSTSYTFGPNTKTSANGTMIVVVGNVPGITDNPSEHFYLGYGNHSGTFTNSQPVGRVLKDPNGTIIDAVGYRFYSFPSSSGVTAAHWSAPPTPPSSPQVPGMLLFGPDNNRGTSWRYMNTSSFLPRPRTVNPSVVVPQKPYAGFSWTLNGTVVDSIPQTTVGPFPADGVYYFVASNPSPCGIVRDTAIVHVGPPEARAQFIHDLSDYSSPVDIWFGNDKVASNIQYRGATPFLPVAAESALNVSFTTPNAPDISNPVFQSPVTFSNRKSHIVVACGQLNPSNFSTPSPADVYSFNAARENPTSPNIVDVLLFHGAPDAPRLDLDEVTTAATHLITNVAFGTFGGYKAFTPADYEFMLRVSGGSDYTSYNAPLLSLNLTGRAITVLISGYAAGSATGNASPFGLWVARSTGGPLIPLQVIFGIGLEKLAPSPLLKVYPNPASDIVNLTFGKAATSPPFVEIVDVTGKTFLSQKITLNDDHQSNLDVSQLAAGHYFLRVHFDDLVDVVKMQVVR